MPNQYRNILRATSIFGATQFIQILVGLLRSKLVALFVGTTGMGLNSIYMSSIWIFITIFGMGVNLSVVKDLSKAFDVKDWQLFSKIVMTFKHLLLFLGIIGMLFVIAFSPILSYWCFNDTKHMFSFCFLSLVVLFTLLSQGNIAIFVSSRRIKTTALCSLYSSIVSLLVAVPFFYFLRIDGIVPGIVFSTISNYLITFYFAKGIKLESSSLSFSEQIAFSKSFIKLGLAMVVGGLLTSIANYLLNLSISKLGGLSDLGLYSAGFTITLQALSMIFASMSSDYFPRLSAAIDCRDRMNRTINEQSEIVLLLATPILSLFMLLAPLVVRILLSEEFLPVTSFVRILCVGMLLRAASYALGYASFAKGDKKIYLIIEGIYANFANLLLAVSMYYLWGLYGMAWSFVINYILYYFVIKYVDSKRYGYIASGEVLKLIIFSVTAMLTILLVCYLLPYPLNYSFGGVLVTFLCFIYLRKLDKKTDLFKSLLCRVNSKMNH